METTGVSAQKKRKKATTTPEKVIGSEMLGLIIFDISQRRNVESYLLVAKKDFYGEKVPQSKIPTSSSSNPNEFFLPSVVMFKKIFKILTIANFRESEADYYLTSTPSKKIPGGFMAINKHSQTIDCRPDDPHWVRLVKRV